MHLKYIDQGGLGGLLLDHPGNNMLELQNSTPNIMNFCVGGVCSVICHDLEDDQACRILLVFQVGLISVIILFLEQLHGPFLDLHTVKVLHSHDVTISDSQYGKQCRGVDRRFLPLEFTNIMCIYVLGDACNSIHLVGWNFQQSGVILDFLKTMEVAPDSYNILKLETIIVSYNISQCSNDSILSLQFQVLQGTVSIQVVSFGGLV